MPKKSSVLCDRYHGSVAFVFEVRFGSITALTAPKRHFRIAPINGHQQTCPVGPFRADSRRRAALQTHVSYATAMDPSNRSYKVVRPCGPAYATAP